MSGLTLSAGKKKPDWSLIRKDKGGSYELKSISREEFSIDIVRNSVNAKAATIACITIDKDMHAQNKLIFMCRTINDNPVKIHVMISYKNGKKSILKFGPKFIIKGKAFNNYKLPLDSTFKLGDALYRVFQLKVSVDISGAKPGTKAGVCFKNLRFVSPEDASFSSKKGEIVIYPRPAPVVKKQDNPLKVYFHFDNEDYYTYFGGRGRNIKVHDNCQYPGFRSMLLSTVKDQTTIVRKVADADVIVYSAARPFPDEAKQIVNAVKQGTPVYIVGPVADPEIMNMLPGKVNMKNSPGLPERRTLKPVNPDNKLFAGLNPAAFGIYYSVTPGSGSTTLLTTDKREPVILEGHFGKGKVLYSSLGIGVNLIKRKKAYDAFFIRALSKLSGRKLQELDKEPIKPVDGYYTGAGHNNFGRFGFALGDGLLTETIDNDLTVGNGAQEYSFSTRMIPKTSLINWNISYLGKSSPEAPKKVNFKYKWHRTGKFELTTSQVIPAGWKEKSIYFVVQGGIDDISKVYVNGQQIGEITADMPRYWMRPINFKIPAAAIRFGQQNQIRIITENLRQTGGFGSCPEITALAGRNETRKFVADRINFLGKGGVISEKDSPTMRFDTSLAFPGVRWKIFVKSVDMTLSNIAEYAAFPVAGKIEIIDLKKANELKLELSAPWMLLFGANVDHPLLLVMQKCPEKILVNRVGKLVSGLTFKNGNGVGVLVPLWLYGRAPVKAGNWKSGLPDDVVKRISFWFPKAFNFPVAANEVFALDRKSGRINIRTTYSYKNIASKWLQNAPKYAPVSPLAYLTKGMLFEGKDVTDWGLVTSYGNYAARNGSDTVEWSLPLPAPVLAAIPAINECPDIYAKANVVFANGLKWSAGGRVKCSDWTPAYPQGVKFPKCLNINMHGWLHGLPQALTAPYALTQENTANLIARVKARMIKAVELYQYKAAQRWREEPFSGIRYPIYFNNRHIHSSKYAKGFGTAMNYGDLNETAMMILRVFQFLADRYGQRDFVLANNKFIDHVSTLLLSSDDWAYLACHCRESGQSATIDMLNSEYSSMMKLARLAQISGDEALEAQALYRGARRMVPTLARFTFRKYAIKHNLIPYPDNALVCVGFAEDGARYRSRGFTAQGLDLYDMSQGVPEDLIFLYKKYLGAGMNPYFDKEVFPRMLDKKGQFRLQPDMLNIIAQASNISDEKLKMIMNSYMNQEANITKRSRDWPGMTLVTDVSQVIYRLYGKVQIHTAKDLYLKDFLWNNTAKTVRIKLKNGAYPELVLESALVPVEPQFQRDGQGRIKIPLRPNRDDDIVIHFKTK